MISPLDGLASCDEAFLRLIESRPAVAAHVGLPPWKITAGIVSVEAGFDRGYLKKSRDKHKSLIARIDAFRSEALSSKNKVSPRDADIVLLKKKLKECMAKLLMAESQRDAVLSQNILLYDRIRSLEKALSLSSKKLTHLK